MKKSEPDMRMRGSSARAAVGMLAAGGLLLGHKLGYAIVFRDEALRSHVLSETGHGWLPTAGGFAVIAALLALVAWVADGVRSGGATSHGRTFASLALIQSGGFMLLEMVERSAAAIPSHHAAPALLPLGVIVQVAVAAAAAVLLHLIGRAARAAARLLGARPRFVRAPRIVPASPRVVPAPRRLLGSRLRAPRAPPAVLVA